MTVTQDEHGPGDTGDEPSGAGAHPDADWAAHLGTPAGDEGRYPLPDWSDVLPPRVDEPVDDSGPDHDDATADGPRLPTPEEVATYRPAQDLFLGMLDVVSEATLGRPLKPRVKVSPAGLLRGEVDLVKVELPAYAVAGLVVDRFVVRAERVRVQPGLPPVLVAEPAQLQAWVSQENLDRWTRDLRLPFRLRLTDEGVVTTTGIGGIRVSEVLTTPDAVGGFLKLSPRRASLLGVPAPLARFLRGYLPLPPLPRGARLTAVDPREGEIGLTFRIDRFEQPLTPDVTSRLRQLLNLPLPGLRR